ncbi:MAG TPA: bacteriocin [Kofleriaceae bacterium]|nr:bacteriocin [Kofleriaceae bacterium]
MTTISTDELATITGGVTHGAPGSRTAQYNEMCRTPDPATARAQYDWMRAHEIADSSEAPGVKHRVVQAIGNLCGWK